jgi:hypothetical protein
MKTSFLSAIVLIIVASLWQIMLAQEADSTLGYIIRHESQIGKPAPGPHDGTGETMGYGYFTRERL